MLCLLHLCSWPEAQEDGAEDGSETPVKSRTRTILSATTTMHENVRRRQHANEHRG